MHLVILLIVAAIVSYLVFGSGNENNSGESQIDKINKITEVQRNLKEGTIKAAI